MDIEKKLEKIEKHLEEISNSRPLYPETRFFNEASSDEIDLRELWNVLWGGKWLIIGVTTIFAALSVAYALSLPNIYKSEALLAPAEDNSGGKLAGMAGQLGGLASLAGVNLGGGGDDKTTLALEVLKSREFITHFIEKHDLLVPLMAADDWDRDNDELIIDDDDYDMDEEKWVRDVSHPFVSKPSTLEAYERFTEILKVTRNKETDFVSLGIEFYSPNVAKQWVDWLVDDINTTIMIRDVDEARRSIKYLTSELQKTSIANMQVIFFELIEEQTKKIMFAEVRNEYVFKTLDKAVSADIKSKPKRGIIVLFALLFGAAFGAGGVLIRYFLKK